MALLSALLGLSIVLMPKGIYEQVMDESDLMAGNFTLILFIASCVLGFILGARIVSSLASSAEVPPIAKPLDQELRAVQTYRYALVFGVFTVLWNFIGSIVFVASNNLTAALASGNGEVLRDALIDDWAEGKFGVTSLMPVTAAFCYWSLDRYFNHGSLLDEQVQKKWSRLLVFCIASQGFAAIVMLQRSILIPFVVSILLLLSARKWHKDGVSLTRGMGFGLMIAIFSAGLFLFIALFRDSGEKSIFYFLFGYIPASYNRLAATLSGDLVPAFPDRGYYSFRWLLFPPIIRRFLPMKDIGEYITDSKMPASIVDSWILEFSSVGDSGLISFFIWPTAYGYAYFDFGWFSFVYFAVFGVMAAIVWRNFIQHKTAFSAVLYPVIASGILLWSTDNFLALPSLGAYILVALALAQLEKIRLFR